MYKIIGDDQNQYGPVTAEELRRWIAEGRADAQTLVQAGDTTEWKRLGTMPEFAASFPVSTPQPFPTVPPPPTGFAGRTNGLAVAGFVLAILGVFCCGPLFSTLGLIFCAVALGQINRDPTQRGRGLAIAGLVLAVFGYLLFLGHWGNLRFRPGWRRFGF